jgi:putative ABC transport system permease protein
MRHILTSWRRRPGSFLGTLVALTVAAVLMTAVACLLGTSLSWSVHPERLAGTTVVVTGHQEVRVTSGTGANASTDTLPLPSYRRVPAALVARVADVPGVAEAVADVSFPVALQLPDGRTAAGNPETGTLTGHGWQSAVLTPFVMRGGHAPDGTNQVVVGAGLASVLHLRVGDAVRLAGDDLGAFRVVGVAGSPRGNPAQDGAVFFSPAEASALYGHAGQVDLVGVVADRGVQSAVLATRIRSSLGSTYTVWSGGNLGKAENLGASTDARNLEQFASQVGADLILITLFVAAAAVALSIAQRRRWFTLLRAVGATSGQIRRMVLLELMVFGIVAGVAGFVPGRWMASQMLQRMASHQLAPDATRVWSEPWIMLVVAGICVAVAELAGFAAARRASRISPAAALRETDVERRWPHPARVVFGLVCLAGGATLYWALSHLEFSAYERISLSLELGLILMAALALLGPLIVAFAELLLRLPVRAVSRVGGRLALTELRASPRRVTAAVVAVSLAVAFVGVVTVIDATEQHVSVVQGRQQLVADAVVSAPGPGLSPAALAAIARTPGVSTAIGATSTDVFVPDPGNDLTDGELVSRGPLDKVLDLRVVAGTFRHFGPGDIALSRLQAGNGAVGAHVGQRITAYLSDGTPYRATVTAIYFRSFGFGDVIIPSAAVGDGHLNEGPVTDVLVRATPGVAPRDLVGRLQSVAARFPGVEVAPRSVVNAEEAKSVATSSYANNLILGILVLLLGVALVNTLVVAAVDRRESLRLLRRLGTTHRQLLSMTTWQAILLGFLGVVLGFAVGAPSLIVLSEAISGSWVPYLTWPPLLAIVAVVMTVIAVSTLGPTACVLAFDRDR